MADDQRDYVAIATAYAKRAAADRKGKTFGKWVRLAAKRYLEDLKRAKRKGTGFTFDPWHAHDVCDFIEKLPHVEGTWETECIVLHESHVFFLVNLFGFRNEYGRRRFTHALFAVARKNAKSTLAAGIALYCLCCEGESGPQVVSAATTGDQARIIWSYAKRMVEKLHDLQEAFSVQAFARSIACYSNGGFFKPINAKASTQDGLNPSCVVLDELHAHKTHDLLNVLRSAGGGRDNPLWLYTTTEGYETPGPWPEERKFAHQVLEKAVEADHYLALVFALDAEEGKEGSKGHKAADDELDETKWIKANPLIEVNPALRNAIRKDAIEARAKPGAMAEFRIKRCNRPSASADSWVDLAKWKSCNGAVDLEALRDVPCWGGLDLASTQDLTVMRLVWKVGDDLLTWARRWVPDEGVRQRTERGTVPYQTWVEAGHIEQTEGNVTDYAVVEQAVLDVKERFTLQQMAYDRWNATDLVSRLVEKDVPLIEFVQGPKSFHPAMQALERRYLSGQLAHGGDPVLQWCAANLVPRYDQNLNMAPDRKRSADKIDDMVALIMATGLATNGEGTEDLDDFLRSPLIA